MARKRAAEASPADLFNQPPAGPPPLPAGFPPNWEPALTAALGGPKFVALQEFLRDERAANTILPRADEVFTALALTPPEAVRVVVLGQDPYPTPGHAHGLAFSVRPDVRPLPASLKNIFKELHADLGIPTSPHGDLRPWAKQGVLLLNTVLTVRAGSAGSHARRGWEEFTDAVIAAVASGPNPVVFLLWGRPAQKKAGAINQERHAVLMSAHPSPLSAHNGFFGSKPFSAINAKLAEWGKPPIDWALPALSEPEA